MARTLLKEKPKVAETRRVRFHAPADMAARMDALIARAQEAGFDLDLDAALAEAYGGIVRKLERELADVAAGVADGEDAQDADAGPTGNSAPSAPSEAEPGRGARFDPAA
jgi:hypothetical protein